jgi:hypothetical protein
MEDGRMTRAHNIAGYIFNEEKTAWEQLIFLDVIPLK